MILGINHVGLSVPSLERSIEFYRDSLQMELVLGPVKFDGVLYQRILALDNVRGRACLLKNGSLELELFEFENPAPEAKDADTPVCNHGISHFCVEVSDIDSTYERLKNAGVTFHCPPMDFGTARATYARDPDGNVFEILELCNPRRPEV